MVTIQPSSNLGVLRNRQLKRFYLLVSMGQVKILACACSEVIPLPHFMPVFIRVLSCLLMVILLALRVNSWREAYGNKAEFLLLP